MENRITIIGNVENIKKVNYVDIKDTENKIWNCYIVKAVAHRMQITKEGQRVEVQGWEKEFRPGKKFFVIHKIKRLEDEKKDYSNQMERANEFGHSYHANDYLNDVLNHVLDVQGIIEGDELDQRDLMEIEIRDTGINEGKTYTTFAKNVSRSYKSSFHHWAQVTIGTLETGRREVHKPIFYTSQIVEKLQGMNLGLKKWGAKFEGKLKIEVLKVRFFGKAFTDLTYDDRFFEASECERIGDVCHAGLSGIAKIGKSELQGWFRDLMNGQKKTTAGKKFNTKNGTPYADAIDYLPHVRNEELNKVALMLSEEEGYAHDVRVEKIRITIVR